MNDPRFRLCDDCYGGCFVGDCRDPHCECPECGGLAERDLRLTPHVVAGDHGLERQTCGRIDLRCPHCRNYWDTPGHFYGCGEVTDGPVRAMCVRWQDVRGKRFVFSCECAGKGCPDAPPHAGSART